MEMAFQLILSFLIHHVFFRCVCSARERTNALDCVCVVQLSAIVVFFALNVHCLQQKRQKKRCLQPNSENEKKHRNKRENEKPWQRRKPKTASCVSREKAVCMMMLVVCFIEATTLYEQKEKDFDPMIISDRCKRT